MPKDGYIFRRSPVLFKRFELFASIFSKVAIEVDVGGVSIIVTSLKEKVLFSVAKVSDTFGAIIASSKGELLSSLHCVSSIAEKAIITK